MDPRIRNWSALGALFLGIGAAGLLWHNAGAQRGFSLGSRASAGQPPAPAAIEEPAAATANSTAERAFPSGKPASGPAEPADAGLLLPRGESLEFTAHVAKLSNVAALRLVVGERRSFLGRPAWHLQAFAHTQNPLRMVFELDDQFDSYSDAATLASFQYELHLSERGQKVNSVLRMTTGGEPAPPDATAARVVPGTRDPLGMMQYLRTVDWKKTPEVRSPVFDGHKLYDVRARLAGVAESVTVPAGQFTASKIALRVFDGGVETKDTNFALYLANNAAHTPVLLEAVLPFANARVELLRAQ